MGEVKGDPFDLHFHEYLIVAAAELLERLQKSGNRFGIFVRESVFRHGRIGLIAARILARFKEFGHPVRTPIAS